MRHGMQFLLESAGLQVEAFERAEDFIAANRPTEAACLLLDMRMPGMSGLELQRQLRAEGFDVPVIFITAYGDVPTAVEAMRDGAVDFIEKPFDDQALIAMIRRVMANRPDTDVNPAERPIVERRYAHLTSRQREVLRHIVTGMMNKQIATELRISIRTVENHRAAIMLRMGAVNTADLVRMALQVLPGTRPGSHGA